MGTDRGRVVGVYFNVHGGDANPLTRANTNYEFYVRIAADRSYHMLCQIDNEYDKTAEWAGNSFEEFKTDFGDATSLDWI